MKQKRRRRSGDEKAGQARNQKKGKTRGWIAMGALVAYAAMGGTRTALAAPPSRYPNGDNPIAATLPLKRFDIAAGPLEKAIAAYEETTGLTVKFVLPTGTLAGFNSKGVVGLFRDDEALRRILDGTGLNAVLCLRLCVQRDAGADAAADRARPSPRQAPVERSRKDGSLDLSAPRRQDPGDRCAMSTAARPRGREAAHLQPALPRAPRSRHPSRGPGGSTSRAGAAVRPR